MNTEEDLLQQRHLSSRQRQPNFTYPPTQYQDYWHEEGRRTKFSRSVSKFTKALGRKLKKLAGKLAR
ncbi:hypothetical protein HETIRDRAFT_173987 [Heterobasidion irregulare TC 32-1]|uniref:Uncharacterized protein n=1 Tax=Heterobasidion irregulare (strain TC 32-1) TaxID=747525 RepID=W4JV10_HETIT|nr:uncharacterized protein HETIRDRAFT_173987 [Heterobasidion irregulare TC 32-1]ETW77372.1 hypothetical protein HETIRDRAFT_173987 [Heterobasidion irregulare TC 32-1]